MPRFKRVDNREVLAFRIEIPITVGPGLLQEREFHPGDWILLDQRLRFMRDAEFRRYHTPLDAEAQRLCDARYDLVVDENRPCIPFTEAQVGRGYLFVLQRQDLVLPAAGVRGVVEGFGMYGLNVRTHAGETVPVMAATVTLVIPEDPETEPCLLRSRGSTDQERAPRPDS